MFRLIWKVIVPSIVMTCLTLALEVWAKPFTSQATQIREAPLEVCIVARFPDTTTVIGNCITVLELINNRVVTDKQIQSIDSFIEQYGYPFSRPNAPKLEIR